MPIATQQDRGLVLETPLGNDVLLPTALHAQEGISRLFQFNLDLIATADQSIPFEKLLGQQVSLVMTVCSEAPRVIRGIINHFAQSGHRRITQDGLDTVFTNYHAQLVPDIWLLTKRVRSRIFQRFSIPDILAQVFTRFHVTFKLQSTYLPLNYCVQYQETDFAFASRLMEDEGITYFFSHSESDSQMIVTDFPSYDPTPVCHQALFEQASVETHQESRITAWNKTQTMHSQSCILWDHSFQLPGNHLVAHETTLDTLKVGAVTHRLTLGSAEQMELYTHPGGYAHRFDSVDPTGSCQPQSLRHVFDEAKRKARIRMQQEESTSLEIQGSGTCGYLVPGFTFELEDHFDADGSYLVKSMEHCLTIAGYDSGSTFEYRNTFTCVPASLEFRPPRTTPKPVIPGIQTATVVGPAGNELFCDKYGRVKVQFHWDREGKTDANSSCWLRVAQIWAGDNWGAFFWPRIGNEVIVLFEEGDPDRPLIAGSLYNADNMPPFELPARNNLAGFKSASIQGRAYKNFNGIVFDDQLGQEHLALHSERHMSFNSEFDKVFHAGRHKAERVAGSNMFTVGNLPGGGGSGGGSQGNPYWPKPYPQGIVGLNSAMVFGENMQAVVGTNHQLALGNNFQICINPAGLMMCSDILPEVPFFTEALSSGIGGNMQLTVGTSAQLVYGQNIEVDAGMPKLELHRDGKTTNTLSYGLVTVIGCLVGVYALAYGLEDKDWERALTTVAFQTCLDVLLVLLMKIELEAKQADTSTPFVPDPGSFVDNVDDAMDRLREKDRQELMGHAKHINWTMEDEGEFMGSQMRYSPSATAFFEALIVVLGVAVTPLILVAAHDKDAEQNSNQS